MNIFIDTNIYLSFYHLSDEDLEEIRKLSVLLEREEVWFWLPQQVKDEFFRNRENKAQDAIKRLKDQNKKVSFPVFCKNYPEFDEIRELQGNFNNKMKNLKGIWGQVSPFAFHARGGKTQDLTPEVL